MARSYIRQTAQKSQRLSTAAQAFKQFLLDEAEHLTAQAGGKQMKKAT